MTAAGFQALLPLLLLGGGATLMMLQIAFVRGIATTTALAVFTLGLAAASAVPAGQVGAMPVTPLLYADQLALLLCILFCLAGAATVLLSAEYLQNRGDQPEEYFLLLVLATLGACVMAYSAHLASLLLGLELLSIALYALIAYPDRSILPLEAAIKYLVLSGATSAILLFGFALLYGATGSLQFSEMGAALAAQYGSDRLPMIAAAMVLVGLAFKLSLVPLHLWTADVYDGAPAPVAGYLASVAKAAAFVVLLRLVLQLDLLRYEVLIQCTGLLAILSMLAGNLLALLQTNLKRMLAFSSIAHVGYLTIILMATLTGGRPDLSTEALVFYLIAYTITTLAAFALLTWLSVGQPDQDRVELRELTGLFWRQPLAACLMLVAMLSLAGIPLTAGFIAKFYIFGVAVAGANWILLGALILGSGIGIYYYLRVVYFMTLEPEVADSHPTVPDSGWIHPVLSCALIAGVLLLGTLPQPLLAYLRSIL